MSIFLCTNSLFSVFFSVETFNDLPPCVASSSSSINPSLTLTIAFQFDLTVREAEELIKRSLSKLTLVDRPVGFWKEELAESDLILFFYYSLIPARNLADFFFNVIITSNLLLSYPLFGSWMLTDSVLTALEIGKNNVLLATLIFLSAFIFLQVFFVRDVLLLFVVMDLALSVFAVLFSLTGLFTNDFFAIAFFFILLTLAACETAISLGFLVSFSRRHKSASLTLSSLRYAVV